MRKITDGLDEDAIDMWVVCNNSTEYSKQEVSERVKIICTLYLMLIEY